MPDNKVLVLAICGATCSGKTSTANELNKLLPNSKVFNQDDYFFDVNDSRHVWIPELNHINFDVVGSLDMDRMTNDIKEHTASQLSRIHVPEDISACDQVVCLPNKKYENLYKIKASGCHIVIVEGFCILNYKPLADLCDLKYYLTLNYEECFKRRMKRVYEPPDCPGYFEKCAWPEHLKQASEVKQTVQNVKYFNEDTVNIVDKILSDIVDII
ncbi:nicotinamide riboside kinase 1 [Rhynchophorus ferrugineus]|uniref:nicotinamide riboside kinase 1 n=1 Tax=Rhynchophorus ferrugineus TaxID=354439 RepID=UPI003FCE7F58